jgi:hypothetical protein
MSGSTWGDVGRSLKAKLSLVITAILVLAIVLVALFLLREQQESLKVEMTKRGLAIAENLASGAKTPLLQNDDLSLNVLVRYAMKHGRGMRCHHRRRAGYGRTRHLIGETVTRQAPLAWPATR